MSAAPILAWLRCYGLALACAFAPFLLVNCGSDFAVGLLVQHKQLAKIPDTLSYMLHDLEKPERPPAETGASGAGSKPAEKKTADEKKFESDLKKMEMYARHIAGRYNFSVGSGLVYLASLVAILFAVIVIYQRKGRIWLGVTIGASCVVAAYVTRNVVQYPYARPLVMDGIFKTADEHAVLKELAVGKDSGVWFLAKIDALLGVRYDEGGTARAVNHLMEIDTLVGVTAVCMLIGVFAFAALRDQSLTLDDLKRRLREIRVALVLASTILVLYVLVSKVLLQWPLSLLADAQRPALQIIADAVLLHWSASATIVLLLMFLPSIFAWHLDVEAYRRGAQVETGAAADDGLQFAPLRAVTSIIIALAPLLVSPFADALKSVLKALPVH